MKRTWTVLVVIPHAAVFALCAFAITTHALAPDRPAPTPGVYIGALGSFCVLMVLLPISRSRQLRRMEARAIRSARIEVESPR